MRSGAPGWPGPGYLHGTHGHPNPRASKQLLPRSTLTKKPARLVDQSPRPGGYALASGTSVAWSNLSRTCHHHPYELAPTAGQSSDCRTGVRTFTTKVGRQTDAACTRSTSSRFRASRRPLQSRRRRLGFLRILDAVHRRRPHRSGRCAGLDQLRGRRAGHDRAVDGDWPWARNAPETEAPPVFLDTDY